MYSFIKSKTPELIVSRRDLKYKGVKTGWVEEEWLTREISVPDWWNEEFHRMVEKRSVVGQLGLVKFCIKCDRQLPDQGCKHNLKVQKDDNKRKL